MTEKTRLGGNIVLEGFEDLSIAESVVAKKIIGGYARRFSDELKNYEEFTVSIEVKEEAFDIKLDLLVGSESQKSEANGDNIFFTLGDALKKLENKTLK